MRYPVSSFLPLLIIILSLIHTVTAEWSSYAYLSTKIPAHTYAVFCAANSQISGNVTWSGTNSDLDLFAFKQGSDILDRQAALVRFQTTTPQKQAFLINCSITGTYYLRVQPFLIDSISQYLTYFISYGTTLKPRLTQNSSFYYKWQAYRRKQVFLLSPPITTGIAVKYESLDNNLLFSISCFGTSFSSQYKLANSTIICLPPSNSSYIFMIKDNLSPQNYFQPIEIFMYYDPSFDCSSSQIASNKTILSEEPDNFPSSLMIAVIVGCVFSVAVTFIIVCYCRWRLKKIQGSLQVTFNPYAQKNSIANLHLGSHQVGCSICLDINCDAKLLCGHSYHKKCIEQWMKRNNQCPICRIKLRKSKIDVN